MNKKGFTLFELLAVIVILLIILAIAVPKVFQIVELSEKNMFLNNVKGFGAAAAAYFESEYLTSGATPNGANNEQVSASELHSRGYLKSTNGMDNSIAVYMNHLNNPGVYIFASNDKYNINGKNKDDVKITDVVDGSVDYEDVLYYAAGFYFNGTSVVYGNDQPYADTSLANEPVLHDGLLGVYYNAWDKVWCIADWDNPTNGDQWYDYSRQKWANAITVKASRYDHYYNAKLGEEVRDEDILDFFVWIPRFEYRISGNYGLGGTGLDVVGEIETNFVAQAVTTPTAGYRIHPAFTFGGVEQAGFWIGKFESANDFGTIKILPYKKTWVNQPLKTMFDAARNMEAPANPYSFTDGVTMDTHMIKNSEWGAVAYLSQSKYGRYSIPYYIGDDHQEIFANLSELDMTGCSVGANIDWSNLSGCFNYDEFGYGTGGSTTGTVYGVYDMAGGAFDATMGNFGNNLATATSGFSSMPAAKYYDLYTNGVPKGDTNVASLTMCSGSPCYGHAISETYKWRQAGYFDNDSFALSVANPWVIRGGMSYWWKTQVYGISGYDGSAWQVYVALRVAITSE